MGGRLVKMKRLWRIRRLSVGKIFMRRRLIEKGTVQYMMFPPATSI